MTTEVDAPKRYSKKRKQWAFIMEDEETGKDENYVLREPDGDLRDEYLNTMSNRFSSDTAGKSHVKDFKGMQADLLSRTTYTVLADGHIGALVPVATIQAWPSSVVEDLFERAQKLAGMDTNAEKDAKKD